MNLQAIILPNKIECIFEKGHILYYDFSNSKVFLKISIVVLFFFSNCCFLGLLWLSYSATAISLLTEVRPQELHPEDILFSQALPLSKLLRESI